MTAPWPPVAFSCPRALGGGPLAGDRIVRIAYLDEFGIGDPAREPHVVVAATCIHADLQWKEISQYLFGMAAKYVPKEKISNFMGFHALELFSGGKTFERKPGEYGSWWHVLEEILSLPAKFDLPVIYGVVERKLFLPGTRGHDNAVRNNIDPIVAAQMVAFTMAAYGIEHWMKRVTQNEVIEMIMENNSDTRDALKALQRMLMDPHIRGSFIPDDMAETFNFSRIIWPVRFEEKGDETSPLQLADACAWAIRRRLAGEPDSDRFYNLIAPQIINTPREALPEVRARKPRAQTS